jgi:hypothetical protein
MSAYIAGDDQLVFAALQDALAQASDWDMLS